MASYLGEDERRAAVAQAQNIAAAQLVLRMLRGEGLGAPAIIAATITAATATIEANWPMGQRLAVLNALLGDTINEWAAAAPSVAPEVAR
jgi:hypothetical protein